MTQASRIDSVEVCAVRVPLDPPVVFSTAVVACREYCLVRVRSADGHEGLGFSYAREKTADLLTQAVRYLGLYVLGEDSMRVEGIWEKLYREGNLLGRAGLIMRAQSAIDIAIWDLNSSRAGLPLYRYLGAHVVDRVPAYASGGYYGENKSLSDLAGEMRGFAEAGYGAVKMKIGAASVDEDERRVSAVRSAIGPHRRLMLDANNAWKDVPTALDYLECLAPYRPFWIEEPFTPDDVGSLSRLSCKTDITIATGECESGRWRFKQLLDSGVEILQPDAIVCGGVTEWRRIAAIASAYGVSLAPHAWHDIHVHLVAATPNATYVEFMPDASIVNFRLLLAVQLEVKDGALLLPERPGIGIVLNDAAVEQFAIRDEKGGVWRSVNVEV